MDSIEIRPMQAADRLEVAELICVSTNFWYRVHGHGPFFSRSVDADVFFDVYEALDPGCGLVAVSRHSGRLAGSCFVHPRATHISLGIMNVHPNHFGCGVGRELLDSVVAWADREQKPLRLVSSAMNLDSYSLYTRAGFVPRAAFQDMVIDVPPEGLDHTVPNADAVREATPGDVEAMTDLEMELVGICRDKDFRHFLENREGFWHVSVAEGPRGGLDGFLVSSAHRGINMIGPGVMRTPREAAALLLAELNRQRGRHPIFVLPVDSTPLVQQAYTWGARNCEIHFAQCLGPWRPPAGVVLPAYLPETG